jgi:hypothetical protein
MSGALERRTALALAFALASGCARAEPSRVHSREARQANDAGVAIDTEVMAYLSMARARHHEANLDEDTDPKGALAALDQLTLAKRPHPGTSIPEIEEVLADTFARKAELDVRIGDLDKARESVREGLTHAPTPSYFRGHLLEVAGIVEEARAAMLRDAGRAGPAAEAKAKAIDLLHQAVVVQEKVVEESLPGASVEGGVK